MCNQATSGTRLRIVLAISMLWLSAGSTAHAWKFAVCGDTRTGHAAHGRNVDALVRKMPNETRVTVWNLGDVTADGRDSQWQTWQAIVAPLEIDWEATVPPQYMSPPGNHDAHETGWQARWARYLPSQVGLSAYPELTGQPQGLYGSVKYDNALWVWLDTESTHAGQEAFLGDTLVRAAQDPDLTWRFVLFHRPPIACGGGHGDWAPGKAWHDAYFRPHGVDVVFTGHNHMYSRLCPIVDAQAGSCDEANRGDAIGDSEGVVHITAGGGGASIYAPDTCANQEVGAGVYHFLEVEIDGGQMNLKAWDTGNGTVEAPLLVDEFTIQKGPAAGSGPPSPPANLQIVADNP